MKKILALIVVIAILYSCKEPKKKVVNNTQSRIDLLQTDKDFSELTSKEGMKTSFLKYLDSNGVLLRSDNFPITGAFAIDYLIGFDDSGYSMMWQPHHAVVSSSGDLGYTYGIFSVKILATDSLIFGNYVHVWTKNKNGEWKLALDSGNEGIGEQ